MNSKLNNTFKSKNCVSGKCSEQNDQNLEFVLYKRSVQFYVTYWRTALV